MPKAQGPKLKASAYVDGLQMLARRELSEAQVRQRLLRKGHDAEAVDAAVDRLRGERAINDERAAEAIAQAETRAHRRGKLRVRRQIEQAGIAPTTARQAIDEVFGGIDDDVLLNEALAQRLRGRDRVADEAEFRRLFRYLVGQGFEPDHVMAILERHKAPGT